MKALVFSDLHVHNWAAFSQLNEYGINDRLADTLRVLSDLEEIAVQEAVDCVIFAGDFFHTQKIPGEVLALAARNLMRFGLHDIRVLAVEGNHDLLRTGIGPLSSVEGLRVPWNHWSWLRNHMTEVAGVKIWGTHYGDLEPPKEIPDIAVLHRGVFGHEVSDYFKSDFDKDLKPQDAGLWAKKLVICGHYHLPSHYAHTRHDTTILIPGAPIQHVWSDAGQDRGVWIVNEEAEARFIPLEGFPKFVKVTDKNIEDLSLIDGNFVSVEFETRLPQSVVREISQELSKRSRGFSVQIGKPKVVETTQERIKVDPSSDLDDVVRNYAERFGKDRAKKLGDLGIEILRKARK